MKLHASCAGRGGGCMDYVDYSYTSPQSNFSSGGVFRGTRALSINDHSEMAHANCNGTVLIAYDSKDPKLSRLNFGDRVTVSDHNLILAKGIRPLETIALAYAPIIFIFSLVVVGLKQLVEATQRWIAAGEPS